MSHLGFPVTPANSGITLPLEPFPTYVNDVVGIVIAQAEFASQVTDVRLEQISRLIR